MPLRISGWLAAWRREPEKERAALPGGSIRGDRAMSKTSTAIMNKNGADGKDHAERPRDLNEFEALLRRGRDVYVYITAALASAILAAWNGGNRRLDEIRVQALKRDMSGGRWVDGEPIGLGVFAEGIQLGDGQHRLRAQIASNTDQTYHVRVFTDETEYGVFIATRDSGKPRSLADLLGILGVADGTGAAQAFERITNAMQTFLGATPGHLSRQERLDFAFKHAKEIRYVLGLPSRRFRPHVLAAIAIAFGKQAKPVSDFMAQVISGADLATGSPALEFGKALPELNDPKGAREKDRTMGVVMRVIHDGIMGRRKSTINSRLYTSGSPIVVAIEEFAGSKVAKAWVERNARVK